MKTIFQKLINWFKKLFKKDVVVEQPTTNTSEPKVEQKPIETPTEPTVETPTEAVKEEPIPEPIEEPKAEPVKEPLIDTNRVSSQHIITKFMKSLDDTTKNGIEAVDEAVAYASEGVFSNTQDLVDRFVKDCVGCSGSSVDERKCFLVDYCGINLDNDDTGASSGFDAGGDNIKNATDIIEEDIALEDFVYDRDKYEIITTYDNSLRATGKGYSIADTECYSVDIDGVKFYWNENNWNDIPLDKSVLEQIMGGLISSWISSAMKIVKDSYGISLTEEDVKLRNHKYTSGIHAVQIVLDYNENESCVAKVWYAIGTTGSKGSLKTIYATEALVVNTAYFTNALTNVDGYSEKCSVGSLDRVIAHEMVHSVMAATVNAFNKLPVFIKEGLGELIHGADDTRTSELLSLTNTSYTGYWAVNGESTKFNQEQLLKAIFDLDSTSTNLGTLTYAGGYVLLRYLMKQSALYSKYSNI